MRKGAIAITGVLLKPHTWNTLFKISASELTDMLIELDEFSGENLNGQLLNLNHEQECVALLKDFFIAKLEQAKTGDLLVQESVRLIHKSIRSASVRRLLMNLNISERQFERRFNQAMGLSPQLYIRIIRFQTALKLMQTRRFDRLTDIAYALNFADQSHFIKDIKEFSGITPTGLSQTVDDFIHNQIGYLR